MARAAAATIKKVALELGGKSAAIVLDDAPLGESVRGVLASCFANAGQTCAAQTRVLVPGTCRMRGSARPWRPRWSGRPATPRGGDGHRAGRLTRAARAGAFAHRGGDRGRRAAAHRRSRYIVEPTVGGAYVQPTIFAAVTADMRIFHEEVFGPVLTITPYATIDEAVDLANDSVYGLSAACGRVTLDAPSTSLCACAPGLSASTGPASMWGPRSGIQAVGRRPGVRRPRIRGVPRVQVGDGRCRLGRRGFVTGNNLETPATRINKEQFIIFNKWNPPEGSAERGHP